MKDFLFVSIIIPTRNEEKLLGKCLEGIKQLNYPKEKLEVIISDGMSTDRTTEIAQSFAVKIIKNEKKTVAPARNIAFGIAKGELVAFSDADCFADKDWIINSLKYFKDPVIAGVGGPNLDPINETCFGKAVSLIFSLGSFISGSAQAINSKKLKVVKSLAGSNSIYKKEALVKVMPTDESMLTCDDTEIGYKLKNKGYKLLYAPDVAVLHYRRDNPKKFFKQIYRYAIGRLQLGRKIKGGINLVHVLFGFFLPLFCFSIILALKSEFFFYLFVTVILFLFSFMIFGLMKSRSFKVSLNFILAVLIFLLAWSLGFLKELLVPTKNFN
jgi:cellulose synthase/poly-beta-1,6-N-acetylglucosamine synthase-like glycosyltransferase